MINYQDVVNCFIENNCKLLNTENEFNEIRKNMKNEKYHYIASCGHTHNVFFNVFKNRKTGIVCPKCTIENNKEKSRNSLSINKLKYIEMEFSCIQYLKTLIENDFYIIKAFDCCKADVILKPKNIEKDEWIGIQIKTTSKSNRGYGFHLEQNYDDYIIFCICENDKRMWCIPYNDINNIVKITIGNYKSKYSKYEVFKENINNILIKAYNDNKKYNFDELDTPINIFQKREKEYRKFREMKIDFIKFDYHNLEGTVYDFMIENIKVQEKVGCFLKEDNRILFELCKKNGTNKCIQYSKGDNHLYWLNCDDKKHFFVIPENILIKNGYVGNIDNIHKIHFKLPNLNNQFKNLNFWTHEYLFDYEDINKEKLLNIINIVSHDII